MLLPFKSLAKLKERRLSIRLLSWVIICSSFFALLISAFQLYIDYRRDIEILHSSMTFINDSYLKTLASNAYNMDTAQLDLQLQGILKLQDIEYLEINEISEDGQVILAKQGSPLTKNSIYQEFKLNYPFSKGETAQYSTLHVGASLTGIYQRLWGKAVIIVSTNFIKTLLASFFIFFIFQFLITRHLVAIVNYTRQLNLHKLNGQLILDRNKSSLYKKDELDQLVDSINDMQEKLAEDLIEQKQMEELFSYQASHDSLTDLINRREFERRIESLLLTTKQDKSEHALCFMDLDQFKIVNDTAGHVVGDELLRQISNALSQSTRKSDTLARLGGDEFAILMLDCSLADAELVAKTIHEVVQNFQFYWEEHHFNLGVSIGLVPINETTPSFTELLKDADIACYMAKDQGRDRIHVYHADNADVVQRHGEMQWVARINQALEKNQFCLYAQAIVALDQSADIHYELLIRMLDEKGEIIPPGAFLPTAERYNLMINIDRWVITHAFELLTDNPALLNHVNFFAINLSGQSISNDEILNLIITQLDETGVAAEKLCFEITETAAISNLNSAISFISTLKALGCRFALDDFGSGLSSYGYLKNLPVDYLKIDGMFVKDIVDDPIDYAMVKSINEIGHVMGMQTIAEFVENDLIKDMLKEIGVNCAQGYGIHKPQAVETLIKS